MRRGTYSVPLEDTCRQVRGYLCFSQVGLSLLPSGWLALADSCATPRHSTHPSPKPTLFTAASPPRRPVCPQRQTFPTVPIADAFPSHIILLPSTTSLSLLNTNIHPYPPKYLEPGIGTYHDRNRTRHLLFFRRQQPSPTGLAQTTLVRFDGTLDDDTLLTLSSSADHGSLHRSRLEGRL